MKQTLNFLDSIATGHGTSTYCGSRTYVLNPASHSFLSIVGSELQVTTSNVADVGAYNVDLTVSLQDYSTVSSLTKRFKVTINCAATTLTFTTTPPATTTV